MIDYKGLRKPVKRESAETYLLLLLVSFAVSVVGTRTFLELAGYPQIGNSELHIAHVLWGGLLLFVAMLVPLIWANRWTYVASALLGGAGVGLFIDEVGKFITQSNDYFYPLAAPIIYASFLITVMIYFQVRRAQGSDARTELYSALDGLMEILDRDLDPKERAALETQFRYVITNAQNPEMRALAQALLGFITSDAVQVVPGEPGFFGTLWRRIRNLEDRLFTQSRVKKILILLLGVLGIAAVMDTFILFIAIVSPEQALPKLLQDIVAAGQANTPNQANWFIVRVIMEIAVSILLLVSALFLLRGREQTGVRLGTLGLVFALTTVNLLAFYFDQFRAVSSTLFQLIILIMLIRYRQRYVLKEPAEN